MSENANNTQPGEGSGDSQPNRTNLNNDTTNNNNPTTTSGNNITVSIEYMYETPNIPATQNNNSNNNNLNRNNSSTSSDSNNNGNPTAAGSADSSNAHSQPGTTTSQQSQPQQQTPPAGMRPFPAGVVFLQFRDIPAGNTQERLQTIMNIASEIAVRRIVDLSSVRYNRGITKEKFESLPVVPIKDLDPTVKEDGCSICYEPFVDPIPDSNSDENKKRSREDDDEKKESRNDRKNKRLRSDSSDSNNNNNDNDNDNTIPTNNLSTNIGDVTFNGTSVENTNINAGNNSTQTTNDEEVNPTYDHFAVKAPCGHIFGRECLYKWCKSENTCPLCRQVIAESMNTPITVNSAQAAATTNAAFQRIHDLLYNTNNNNNNNNSTESNNGNFSVITNTANSDTTTPSISNQGSTVATSATATPATTTPVTTASTVNIPFRTSNIVFITPQWYIPPNTTSNNATVTATARTGNNGTTTSNNDTSSSENNDTQTTNDTVDNNSNQSERPSPYERFRAIIGSYFDGLINQNNNSNSNTNITDSSASSSNNSTVNSNSTTNANSTFSTAPSNVQNATRNLDLLAMGNSIRNVLLQQRNVLSGTHNNGDAPTLFNSGVASYRTPSGNVSTYHLGAHEVFHASTNDNNNSSAATSTSTDNQNGENNDNTNNSSSGDNSSSGSNEQEENNSNNGHTHTSTS